MIKIDLEDAYYHVGIHPDYQRFFQFQWKENIFQFLCMPFGYNDAPRLFTQMMKVVAKEIRLQGIRLVIYMDDLLILSPTMEQAQRDRDTVLKILKNFGLTISTKKSVLSPAQIMQYLGVLIDSVKMQFRVPEERIVKILSLVKRIRTTFTKKTKIPLRTLQSLVGTLQAVADCILPTRLHLNELMLLIRKGAEGPVFMTELADQELMWWEDHCIHWNGRQIHPPLPDHYFDTDASGSGWGAWYIPNPTEKPMPAAGLFDKELTSNVRELSAILLALQSFATKAKWENCTLRVRTDNKVAMSYVNRMGGREPHLSRIVEEIHSFCLSRNVLLTADYIPGRENVIADHLSRLESDWTESRLNPDIFQLIQTQWGPFSLDAMAMAVNTQCPRYVSLRYDPGCIYTDFLGRPLDHKENAFVNPPFSMIPRILRKIEEEKLTLVLIVPVWPAQSWWPTVWTLCSDWPLLLPRHPALLQKIQEGKWIDSLPMWGLIAMRLSGVHSVTGAF
ncbi:MAG TPA: DNA N-6-adenine-methyltransferase, partial [Nitrososphaera sp.]|nr:DNA N-6-adenine-methyltransferase [Nitrososphaera sp.]